MKQAPFGLAPKLPLHLKCASFMLHSCKSSILILALTSNNVVVPANPFPSTYSSPTFAIETRIRARIPPAGAVTASTSTRTFSRSLVVQTYSLYKKKDLWVRQLYWAASFASMNALCSSDDGIVSGVNGTLT